jgi:hypothetical protein
VFAVAWRVWAEGGVARSAKRTELRGLV